MGLRWYEKHLCTGPRRACAELNRKEIPTVCVNTRALLRRSAEKVGCPPPRSLVQRKSSTSAEELMALGFGYVGCGFVGQGVHIPNFAGIPDVDLVALAEIRPQLGEKVQRRWGFRKLYGSHHEMAEDPEVEAVGVSAAFSEQSVIARDLLRAGKCVFMEKPMALSVVEAEEMLAAAESGGGRLMVAYMKRYDAGDELAKRLIDQFRSEESMGEPFYARNHGFCGRKWDAGFHGRIETTDEPRPDPGAGRYPAWLPEQFRDPYVGYLQQYTHNVNLLRWFLGEGDAVDVSAVELGPDGYTGIVVLDVGGVRAVIESAATSHYGWDMNTQVFFRNGWVKVTSPPLLLNNVPETVEVYRGGETQEISRPLPDPLYSWSYRREAEHFVACVRSGQTFRSSGEDTLTDIRVFEDIFREWTGASS
jgi:predicted dehydrogenase